MSIVMPVTCQHLSPKVELEDYFFLGSSNQLTTKLNGPIHCESIILRHAMSSAAEAEIAALFSNEKLLIPIKNTLEEMGYQHPPTPMQKDNNTAAGFVDASIKKQKTRTLSMKFYWFQYQQQIYINVFWKPKELNCDDYFYSVLIVVTID